MLQLQTYLLLLLTHAEADVRHKQRVENFLAVWFALVCVLVHVGKQVHCNTSITLLCIDADYDHQNDQHAATTGGHRRCLQQDLTEFRPKQVSNCSLNTLCRKLGPGVVIFREEMYRTNVQGRIIWTDKSGGRKLFRRIIWGLHLSRWKCRIIGMSGHGGNCAGWISGFPCRITTHYRYVLRRIQRQVLTRYTISSASAAKNRQNMSVHRFTSR